MNVLAFDTCSDACTVALKRDDRVFVDHRVASQQHAQLLLPMISALLEEAALTPPELDALVVGRGPGSFTGVRIGIAAGQGLALGTGAGVVPVSTLLAVAEACRRAATEQLQPAPSHVLAVIDARMQEVYALLTRIEGDRLVPLSEEMVLPPAALAGRLVVEHDSGVPHINEFPWPAGELVIGGSGAALYADLLEASLGIDSAHNLGEFLPEASDLLTLATDTLDKGALLPAEALQPVYLRDKVADTMAEQAAGRSAGRAHAK